MTTKFVKKINLQDLFNNRKSGSNNEVCFYM